MSRHKEKAEAKREKGLRGRRAFYCLALAACCLTFSTACRMDMQDQPRYEAYEPSKFFKDGMSSRPLVAGTVPRGYLREDTQLYTGKKAAAGRSSSSSSATTTSSASTTSSGQSGTQSGTQPGGAATGAQGAGSGSNLFPDDVDTFPFPVTREVLDRGQERYQIFCSICHGATGAGDGMIVRRGYKQPPSYHTETLKNAPVGHFFDVMTNGWGSMPAYAQQIPVQDRWAIVAYIRALQLSHPATEPDTSVQARPRTEGEGQR
ncbi:MAG TPA: cytochrome c [Pyrinomonadaceae bacterium]|jgi:mono/diheme cytochrome c family protein